MRAGLKTDFFAPPLPRVFAHRGFSGAYPENTIESFAAAVKSGAPYLECDVHMTRDGEVVVHHDEDLRRTCGRAGLIAQLGYAEVAAADAGCGFATADGTHPFRGRGVRVPRLEELLREFRAERFAVEIKQTEPSLVRRMLEAIDRAGMRRRVVATSEHQQPLDQFRALAPDIPTCFSGREVGALFQAIAARDTGYRPPAEVLSVPPEYESWRLVAPEIIDAAHRLGVEVHVWTVNEEAEMREMLALGIDGIITDFPDRLLGILSPRR